MNNRSIPDVAVIPVLHYAEVLAASAWLVRAFGFAERLRIADHRVQLNAYGGAVVAASGGQDSTEATRTHSVMIRVPDVDVLHARATAAGAK